MLSSDASVLGLHIASHLLTVFLGDFLYVSDHKCLLVWGFCCLSVCCAVLLRQGIEPWASPTSALPPSYSLTVCSYFETESQ